MYFSLDSLDIEYNDDNTPIFSFTDDTNHKIVVNYWSERDGGHLCSITNYKNNRLRGTRHHWWSMQDGGHLFSITNYKNNQLHGIQYQWWSTQNGGHQLSIENYKNDQLHGIQHYWKIDGSYYTEHY
jgi:antitoxin component YwqK of YwqJK toxin-antitoxin module